MPLKYIYFEPCPKCSEINTPEIHIAGRCEEGPKYRLECGTCHYEQSNAYDSIKECAKAWNKESNKAWDYIFKAECERLKRRLNNFN